MDWGAAEGIAVAPALMHRSDSPRLRRHWQAEALSWTDQAHLVAWSPSGARRIAFAAELGQFIQAQEQMEALPLFGRCIDGIEPFCQQLERSIPGAGPLARRVDGPRGIVNLLRFRDAMHWGLPARHRYFIWHDADHLLRRDAGLFGALVEAMMGVAAEAEYVSDDLLLLTRVVLVGGRPLADYAEGAGQQWRPAARGEPFWQLVTGLERPALRVAAVDEVGALGGV